jgi:hypothetical protein
LCKITHFPNITKKKSPQKTSSTCAARADPHVDVAGLRGSVCAYRIVAGIGMQGSRTPCGCCYFNRGIIPTVICPPLSRQPLEGCTYARSLSAICNPQGVVVCYHAFRGNNPPAKFAAPARGAIDPHVDVAGLRGSVCAYRIVATVGMQGSRSTLFFNKIFFNKNVVGDKFINYICMCQWWVFYSIDTIILPHTAVCVCERDLSRLQTGRDVVQTLANLFN